MKKISLFLMAFVFFFDQLTKILVVDYFSNSGSTIKVYSFFNIVLVYNKGISFGMFNQFAYSNYLFCFISFGIICFLLKWFKDSVILSEVIGLAMVIGGAVGNIVDRILYQGVVDFIQLHWQEYYWPSFNIADSAICVGVVFLVISNLDINCKNREEINK